MTNLDSAITFLVVEESTAGQRIDNFLLTRLKGLPKSRLYRAVRTGELRVNKKRVSVSYRLQSGDTIRIPPFHLSTPTKRPNPATKFCRLLEASVLHEDNAFIIVNKPSGVAAHGGSGIHFGVIEAFRYLRPTLEYLELGHRLDRETTGCIVLIKKPSVLKEFHMLLAEGKVEKTYLALVQNQWKGGRRSVQAPLLKTGLRSGQRIVKVHPEGKSAETIFQPLKRFAQSTLLEVKPLTGRTHQIRVHAAHIGHPILGDEKYGFEEQNKAFGVKHLLLHAASLHFELPVTGKVITVKADLDEHFDSVVNSLGRTVA